MFVLPMSNTGLFQSLPWCVYPWISYYCTECYPGVVFRCPWGFKSPLEPTFLQACVLETGEFEVLIGTEEVFSFLLNIPSDNAGRFILWGSLRSFLSPEQEHNLFNCLKTNHPRSWCSDLMLMARIVRHSCYHWRKEWLEESLISKYVVQQL